MPDTLPLPARLEGAELPSLKAALLARRGQPLELDGQAVERINGLGLQLLLSAFQTWQADDRPLRLSDPSTPLLAILAQHVPALDETVTDGFGAPATEPRP